MPLLGKASASMRWVPKTANCPTTRRMGLDGYASARGAPTAKPIIAKQSKTKGAEQEQAANHHKWRPWLGQPICKDASIAAWITPNDGPTAPQGTGGGAGTEPHRQNTSSAAAAAFHIK